MHGAGGRVAPGQAAGGGAAGSAAARHASMRPRTSAMVMPSGRASAGMVRNVPPLSIKPMRRRARKTRCTAAHDCWEREVSPSMRMPSASMRNRICVGRAHNGVVRRTRTARSAKRAYAQNAMKAAPIVKASLQFANAQQSSRTRSGANSVGAAKGAHASRIPRSQTATSTNVTDRCAFAASRRSCFRSARTSAPTPPHPPSSPFLNAPRTILRWRLLGAE